MASFLPFHIPPIPAIAIASHGRPWPAIALHGLGYGGLHGRPRRSSFGHDRSASAMVWLSHGQPHDPDPTPIDSTEVVDRLRFPMFVQQRGLDGRWTAVICELKARRGQIPAHVPEDTAPIVPRGHSHHPATCLVLASVLYVDVVPRAETAMSREVAPRWAGRTSNGSSRTLQHCPDEPGTRPLSSSAVSVLQGWRLTV